MISARRLRTPALFRASAWAVLLAAAVLAAQPAGAEGRKLTASEIESRFIGNTLVGEWAGVPYKQFFDASGNTIYLEDGLLPEMGRWKVDPEKDAYCRWRDRTGWACYEVLDGGQDRIIWHLPGSGKRYPAEVQRGDQL